MDKPPGLPMHPVRELPPQHADLFTKGGLHYRIFRLCRWCGVGGGPASRPTRSQAGAPLGSVDVGSRDLRAVRSRGEGRSARTLGRAARRRRTSRASAVVFPTTRRSCRPEKRPRNGELTDGSWRIDGDWVEVSCSLRTASHRDGVCECAPDADDAKAARTKFRLVRKLSDGTSIVECRPQTGRTHQIRLHLQFLNHPIANDPCYGGELGFAGSSLVDEPPPASSEVLDPTGPRRPNESDADFVRRKCARCASKLDVVDAAEERASLRLPARAVVRGAGLGLFYRRAGVGDGLVHRGVCVCNLSVSSHARG